MVLLRRHLAEHRSSQLGYLAVSTPFRFAAAVTRSEWDECDHSDHGIPFDLHRYPDDHYWFGTPAPQLGVN